MGRHSGFRREYRLQSGYSDRNGGVATGTGGGGGSSHSSDSRGPTADHATEENSQSEFSGMLSNIEKRLSGVQQDFTSAIHKISEKENEKFDLIFAILSELQQRQAHLEESVRSLKAQFPNGNNSACPMPATTQPQQQAPFSSGGAVQSYGQMNGQMGGQMNGNMGNQQPMQQFAGVMQPDGSMQQMIVMPQQQQIIMMQPQNGNGGMQYAAMPQMMPQGGAIVQQMPAPMAMQFIAQNCSEIGQNFALGQDECQASGSSIQAQMDMIKPDNGAWQSEDCSTMDITQLDQQPLALEAQAHNSAMSGVGSSEDASSQEGKVVDDGSPCQMLPLADGGMS